MRNILIGLALALTIGCTSPEEQVYNVTDTATEVIPEDSGETIVDTADTADTGTLEMNPEVLTDECEYLEIGDKACDFTMMNQHGNYVSLSDYSDKSVLLDFSAMWCGPCRSAAGTAEALQDKYSDDGLQYIIVLLEDSQGNTVDQQDLINWADAYGLEDVVVLAGDRSLIHSPEADPGTAGPWPLEAWPKFYYINDSSVIEYHHAGYNENTLDSNCQVLLGL